MSFLYRIHANLRTTVYCNAIAAGGVDEWNFAWSKFEEATIAIEADKLRYALSCTKEPWLLNRSAHRQQSPLHHHQYTLLILSTYLCRYLEYTLDPVKIRKQDATSTIVYIAENVIGQSLAWDFIRARWSYIFNE